jgi:L-ascorbate metabolism protein UlaG (beta-lactamase superfamily)
MTKALKRIALVPAGFAVILILLVAMLWACTPGLTRYESIRLPVDPTAKADTPGLRVTFLGVSTLLIQDGSTAFMTDGFFTRPGYLRVLGSLSPDREAIYGYLDRLKLDTLSAVITLHSHYDHAMDAPIVADTMHAMLVGSGSTAAIAQAYGSPDTVDIVNFGNRRQYGEFAVRFIRCAHGPPDRYPGSMDTLALPASRKRYRTGDCFTLLVEHQGRSMLVTGTAGFVPDSLKGIRADVVYLSVGGLGEQDSTYRASYWKEVVQTTRARRVVLIHWDNFFRPLSKRLTPVPRTPIKTLSDNFPATMRDLCAFARRDTVEVRIAREWAAADPFEGLPADPSQRLPPKCP